MDYHLIPPCRLYFPPVVEIHVLAVGIVQSREIDGTLGSYLYSVAVFIGKYYPAEIFAVTHGLRFYITLLKPYHAVFIYTEERTGLAVDIISSEYEELDDRQGDTEEQKWLMEHCWEYGFILRYPPEKSDVTKIVYEPWHYRYVGKEAAKEITEQNITLEEYVLGQ